jgi:hypothetical protein
VESPGVVPEKPQTEGVVNLWRSAREMQIWQEVHEGAYSLRVIGENYSVRTLVGAEKALLHFDAPRPYFEERLSVGPPVVDLGVFAIPKTTLIRLLVKVDERRPKLVEQASKEAARSQALIEQDEREKGDKLLVGE